MRSILIALLLFFTFKVSAQVSIGKPIPDPSSILDVSSNSKGLLIPRIALDTDTQVLDNSTDNAPNANGLMIFNVGNKLPEGFYYWSSITNKWNLVGEVSLPRFFYLPSVMLPINKTNNIYKPDPTNAAKDITLVAYDSSTDKYTIDLYEVFKHQFKNPITSSNVDKGLEEIILDRNKYEYHVVYADPAVFSLNDLKFSNTQGEEGKLTYKVDPAGIARTSTFMNIVLKVK